jgi:hypothetical protein
MSNGDIDLSSLPPLPSEAAPSAAATPVAKPLINFRGKDLPKGYTTKKPTGVPAAAAPAAAAPPDAAPPTAPPAGAPKTDEESPQAGDWTSSLSGMVSGLVPAGIKERYHNIQQGFGVPAEQSYEKYVARPVTKGVAIGAEDWLLHPQWGTAQGQEQIMRDIHTPYEQLPDSARNIAEAIVPQTIPDVALTQMAFGMPEIGAERKLGEASSVADRLLGNRLARVGAGGVVGGVTSGLTGQGAVSGALTGAAGFAIPETIGKGVESVTRRFGEDSLRRETTMKFGKAITDRLPWLGKLETGDDFANMFVRGGATEKAGQEVNKVKTILNDFFKNRTFIVPELDDAGNIVDRHLTFDQANELKTKYQQGYGYTTKGTEKAGWSPMQKRELGLQIRDHLAAQMDHNLTPQDLAKLRNMGFDVSKGVGEGYKNGLKKYDIAKELSDVFGYNKKALFHPKYGLNQPELIDRLDKASGRLDRAMGKGRTKDLLDVIKRGFVGEGKDIPAKAAKHNWLKHVVGGVVGAGAGTLVGHPGMGAALGGLYGWERGTSMDPAGNVRWSMRPQMDAVESILSNKIRAWRADPKNQRSDVSPALTHANKQRAQNVAGPTATPERVGLIQGHTEAIARGDTPNVQADLNRGDLSIGNVRKMLDNSKGGIQTVFNDLSPTDAIDAFSKVDQGERQALLPILAQHLQNTAGKMQPAERQQMLAKLQAVMASEGTA